MQVSQPEVQVQPNDVSLEAKFSQVESIKMFSLSLRRLNGVQNFY